MLIDDINKSDMLDIMDSEEFKNFTKEVENTNKNIIKEVIFGYIVYVKYVFIGEYEIEITDFTYNKMSDNYDDIDEDFFNIDLLDNLIKNKLPDISYIISDNVSNIIYT